MPEITTTTAAVREALNIGIGKAETLTPETVLLKQMTQDGKAGNLQQALGVGREFGRGRMRRQINKTLTDTDMKIGNMTVEAQKTDAGTTKDQLSEFLQKGYDKNSHQAIRERVEDIVDSRWPGLTAAQKTRAAEDLLRDPSLRGLLLQEIDGINGETEFSGDPGRLTAEKTKLEKANTETESALKTQKETKKQAEDRWNEHYSDDKELEAGTNGYELNVLEDARDERKLQISRLAEDKKYFERQINYGKYKNDTDRQADQKRLDTINSQLSPLLKYEKRYMQLAKQKNDLKQTIDTCDANIKKHETAIKTNTERMVEIDEESASLTKLREIQERIYADNLDTALDAAVEELLEKRLQEIAVAWDEHMPAVKEQLARQQSEAEAKQTAEKAKKEREEELKIARAYKRRYVEHKRETETTTKTKLKRWRLTKESTSTTKTVREVKNEVITGDYEILFLDEVDSHTMKAKIKEIYDANGIAEPANNEEWNKAQAWYLRHVQDARNMAAENPVAQKALAQVSAEDTDMIQSIHKDREYFADYVAIGLREQMVREQVAAQTGIPAEDLAEAAKDPEKAKTMAEKLKPFIDKAPTLFMILAIGITSLNSLVQTEERHNT